MKSSLFLKRISCLLLVGGALFWPTALHAQETKQYDVEKILSEFVCELQDFEDTIGCGGRHDILWITLHSDQVPQETVTALLEGLQRIALTHPVDHVRHAAMGAIWTYGRHNPNANIFDRLMEIYRNTDDEVMRYMIVGRLAAIHHQDEAVIPVLVEIAKQRPGNEDFRHAAEAAVRSLALAGPEGAAALRSLHMSGEVTDRDALGLLKHVARTGYQIKK